MEPEAKPFKYQHRDYEGPKKSTLVCSSDLMRVHVQEVKSGGENNLHTHPAEDAFWYVVNGAVRFYGEGDKVIGIYNKGEGILIPRGFKYWFETASDEPLEVLRIGARDQTQKELKRVNAAPLKDWMAERGGF
jgi:mannose-6-phosphate isomerase-like protein (cupin superfamily)